MAAEALQGIASIAEEFLAWEEVLNSSMSVALRDEAAKIIHELEPIRNHFVNILSRSYEELLDLVESTQEVLERLWIIPSNRLDQRSLETFPAAYSQQRMRHLMILVGRSFHAALHQQLSGMDMWRGQFQQVEEGVSRALRLLAKWYHCTLQLTKLTWPSHVSRPWVGKPFEDDILNTFHTRLDSILKLLEVHERLLVLVSEAEEDILAKERAFQSFAQLDALDCSADADNAWKAAVSLYEKQIAPIEGKIALKLQEVLCSSILPSFAASLEPRSKFAKTVSATAGTHQVMAELRKYKELFEKPLVVQALSIKSGVLISLFNRHLDGLRHSYDKQMQSNGNTVNAGASCQPHCNSASTVGSIFWSLQHDQKVEETRTTFLAIAPILSEPTDTAAAEAQNIIVRELNDLKQDLSSYRVNQLKLWEADIRSKLKSMSLETSGKLLRLNPKDGHVEVTFRNDLVALIRQTRELVTLGFALNPEILKVVEAAQKFQKQAMLLKQVANFYNDISTQLIPCQMVMLLKDALHFEAVLKNPCDTLGKPLLWNNLSAVQSYTERLQCATLKLSEKNRQLRLQHSKLGQIAAKLVGLDLHHRSQQWQTSLQEMSRIFEETEKQGFTQLGEWHKHWDLQVFQILERQYEKYINHLMDNFPEMEVKLVYAHGSIQYDPPFHEISASHFKIISNLLSLPISFRGFGLSLEAFHNMSRTFENLSGTKVLQDRANKLLEQLRHEQMRLAEQLDLRTRTLVVKEFHAEKRKKVEDWDLEFKAIRFHHKKCDTIPIEIKIGSYRISTGLAKASIDDQLKSFHKELCELLAHQVDRDIAEIEDFMRAGVNIMEGSLSSVEDIEAIRQGGLQMIATLPTMAYLRRETEQKLRVLRHAQGSGGVATDTKELAHASSLANGWEAFMNKLSQHEAHLHQQAYKLREKLQQEVQEVHNRIEFFSGLWEDKKPDGQCLDRIKDILGTLAESKELVSELQERAERAKERCKVLQMEEPSFPILNDIKQSICATEQRWDELRRYLDEKNQLADQDWTTMRQKIHVLEDFLEMWGKNLQSGGYDDETQRALLREIKLYEACIPVLSFVKGVSWEQHHWTQLFALLDLGDQGLQVAHLKVRHFLSRAEKLVQETKGIKALDTQATGERSIRGSLNQLIVWSLETCFTIIPYVPTKRESRSTIIIKNMEELLTEIGDNQLLLRSSKESVFATVFKDDLCIWENRLSALQDALQHLTSIQRKWVYLEPIFAKGAISMQQMRFDKLDMEFKNILASVSSDSKVIKLLDYPQLGKTLPQLDQQLDICQRALSHFLEEKRSVFPRFYFVGDDDLLEIVGQPETPEVLQAHIGKIFSGVQKVQFSQDLQRILSVRSPDGETLDFLHPVAISSEIECSLEVLTSTLKTTLHIYLEECLRDTRKDQLPCQMLCLAAQVKFTKSSEESIRDGSLGSLYSDLTAKLQHLTKGLPRQNRKLKSYVLDLIHARDVVDHQVQEKVCNTGEWPWSRQLRFYHSKDMGTVVKMAEADFMYTFEYQGNAPRLVYTPLTDKCFLVLTQGLHLGYGGNIFGPAGTGKTESVKALGRYLGRQVLIFNCDGDFDFKSMGRILTGIIRSGAWGCFDAFNRLEEDVLSALSHQIQEIQAALRENIPEITFFSKTVRLDPNAAVFVTLNPKSRKYGGRSKLPSNLQALFRSVTMTCPNAELIAQVNLMAEGFTCSEDLGCKVVGLFKCADELLTKQHHYDWGLRAIKSALSMAGNFLHGEIAQNIENARMRENHAIVHSVLASTLPKLVYSDRERFRHLVSDIFPGVDPIFDNDAELTAAIRGAISELKLQFVELQTHKVKQLHLACNQRMGVSLIGPSGSGKTTAWQILQRSLGSLNKRMPIDVHVLNPKAMSRHQLLGHMDLDTHEWIDGVLTAIIRQVAKQPADQRSWIVCDGDVDPEWIESLNSVLDDNHLLTLPSGERIQLSSQLNFLFECENLKFASPATVSRIAMVVFSEDDIGVDNLEEMWISSLEDEIRLDGRKWFKDIFSRALDWATVHSSAMLTTKMGTIQNVISHILGVHCSSDFIQGLARGLGANMETSIRAQLYSILEEWSGHSIQKTTCLSIASLPAPAKHPTRASSQEMVQVDNMAHTMAVIWPWIAGSLPVLLVGPEQCGKTTLLEYCFRRLKSTTVMTIYCSAQTKAHEVVERLNLVCTAYTGKEGCKMLTPKDSKSLVLYLRNISFVETDKYETCQLIEFLRQLIHYNGFYNDSHEFVQFESIQIVATMHPLGEEGCSALSPRFTGILRVAYMDYCPKEQLEVIYTTKLQESLLQTIPDDPTWKVTTNVSELAGKLLDIYHELNQILSTENKGRCKFSPRYLSNWVLGIKYYDLRSVGVQEALRHEALCLFRDEIGVAENVARFDKLVIQTFKNQMNLDQPEKVYTTWVMPDHSCKSDKLANQKILNSMPFQQFHKIVEQALIRYEREVKSLHIILFPEVILTIAKIHRILARPGGGLILVGRRGDGRRTCTNLICFMHQINLFTPSVSCSYGRKAFLEDVKGMLHATGIDGKESVLYLEDHQLVEESFLEIINSLLSGNDLSAFYSTDELQVALAPLQELVAQEGFVYSSLLSFFLSRVRSNLHIVLSLDSYHPLYELRRRKNQAIFTRCTVLQLEVWTDEGMMAFSVLRLLDSTFPIWRDKADQLAAIMVAIHKSVIDSGMPVTPMHFVRLVDEFKFIYKSKRDELTRHMTHLHGGLSKMEDAAKKVIDLSTEAASQEELLAQKQAEAENALHQIANTMEMVTARKADAEKFRTNLREEELDLRARRKGVEDELCNVQPQVEAAKKSVGQIRNDHLNELRSLKIPPDAIRDVLEGVLRLMGNYDTSWLNMKRFLGMRTVKEEIMNFDATKINRQLCRDVQKLLVAKASSFDHSTIYHVSVAAAPLAAWVKANVQYALVLEGVRPLQEQIDELSKPIEASKVSIQRCEDDLRKVNQTVQSLKLEFSNRTGDVEALKISLARANNKVANARQLLEKLGGEEVRWQHRVQQIEAELHQLSTSVIMAAAFSMYLAGQTEDYREDMQTIWQRLPEFGDQGLGGSYTPKWFDFKKFMSTESQMIAWKNEGLASDDLSMENAIVIQNSRLSQFIIDPSAKVTTWLSSSLRAQNIPCEVVHLKDPKLTTKLELAVRFGHKLLVQDVDKVEPMLFPLLRRDFNRQGSKLTVQIGGKVVDHNENFQLYLFTRDYASKILPDTLAMLMTSSFKVTKSGLEKQLLSSILLHEQPELELQKNSLLESEEQLHVQLLDLESHLLQQLATSKGDMLENESLLTSLNETKIKTSCIQSSLEGLSTLQASLKVQSTNYEPLAHLGSSLYFAIKKLVVLNPMYRYGLPSFMHLFGRALTYRVNKRDLLNEDESSHQIAQRVSYLCKTLLSLVYSHVSRSLFDSDRLTFGMHLVRDCTMLKQTSKLEVKLFLQLFASTAAGDASIAKKVLLPSWIPISRRQSFMLVHDSHPTLRQSMEMHDAKAWSAWIECPTCEANFPDSAIKHTTPFQRLLLIQALRPDRLVNAMKTCVCASLGLQTFSAPPLLLPDILSTETNAVQPVLFITEAGADPSLELEEYALNQVGRSSYHQLAMGQGQTTEALKMLHECAEAGHWLFLKNLHLVVAWLPALERELHRLHPKPSFRLWLTSETHKDFPVNLAEASLKITCEHPPGVTNKLKRIYGAWTQAVYSERKIFESQMIFSLALLHAAIQERVSYVPIGWTTHYEFSFADLRAGAEILLLLTKNRSDPPWAHIHGLLLYAIYGGQIDNSMDATVLKTYVQRYVSEKLITTVSQFHNVLKGIKQNEQQWFIYGEKRIALPNSSNFRDYVDIVSQLPDINAPCFLGLPANIDSSLQQRDAEDVATKLKAMTANNLTSGGLDKKQIFAHLFSILQLSDASILQLLLRLETTLNRKIRPLPTEPLFPVVAFLLTELEFSHQLLKTIKRSLSNISKFLISDQCPDTLKLADCQTLVSGQILECWKDLWEGPEDPLQYVRSAIHRTDAVNNYCQIAAAQTLQLTSINISYLFHPHSYLGSLRQQAARASGTTVDGLVLVTTWNDVHEPGTTVLTATVDLFIEGALFDGVQLSDCLPQSGQHSCVPPCTFSWVKKDVPCPYSCFINVPLYETTHRSNAIAEIQVPTNQAEKQRWLLCGIAFFLKTHLES